VTRVRAESGFTLIELLVAMSLMIVILSATLGAFERFTTNTKRNSLMNDQQDRARLALDQVARQIRNLANPTTGATTATPTSIAYADTFRLVFQTTDPQRQWVSYCLDGSTATREVVWYQTSDVNSLTPAQVAAGGMVSGCPSGDSNWKSRRQIADYVTNQTTSPARPLFSYFSVSRSIPAPSSPGGIAQGTTPQIVRVNVAYFLKVSQKHPPAESELSTAAYMRNQNQAPTASFRAAVGTSGTYTFDAGASSDPEERTLRYDWYQAPTNTTTVPAVNALPDCASSNPQFPASGAGSTWSCMGTTVVLVKSFSQAKYVFLRVTDPGNLQAMTALPAAGCAVADASSRVSTDCGKAG
jgi:prepilin-type N-terminal cleavage/methylation domain-containing protein